MQPEIVAPNAAESRYFVNVEGVEHPWTGDTITTEQIRLLGNIPASQSVIEEEPDGTERTLGDHEIVHVKPGHRWGRAPKYRRGGEAWPWPK